MVCKLQVLFKIYYNEGDLNFEIYKFLFYDRDDSCFPSNGGYFLREYVLYESM